MSVHPARLVASLSLLAGGFVVGVSVLAIVLAKAPRGRGHDRPTGRCRAARGPRPGAAVHRRVRHRQHRRRRRPAGRPGRAETLAVGTSIVAVVVGVFGLALIVVGRDPFAADRRRRSTADGLGIVGAFTVIYLAVLVALARGPDASPPGPPPRAVAS